MTEGKKLVYIFIILSIKKPTLLKNRLSHPPHSLADCAGLADSLESVTSPFDGGNLFVKELKTIKRGQPKILGTQNLPHN